MRLGGILFDLDGTLFAREAAFWSWLLEEASGRALDWSRIAELDARGHGPKAPLLDQLAIALDWPERALDARLQRLRHGILRHARPEPRLNALLSRLGARYRLGIVTNGSAQSQRGKLRGLGIEQYFEPIVVSEEVAHRKPEFAIFRLALRSWDLPHGEVLFVGDDPLQDIGGARAAGLQTLQVLREPVDTREPELVRGLLAARQAEDGTESIESLWQIESWLGAHAG
jgi:putative hydrolase of the HAD superfamily